MDNNNNQDKKDTSKSFLDRLNGERNKTSNSQKANKAINLGSSIVKLGGNISKVSSIALTLITNPVTWVLTGILLVFLASYSGVSILGQSDYGKNCASLTQTTAETTGVSGGGGGPWTEKGSTPYKTAIQVRDGLKQYGLSGTGIAAVMGNMAQESGFQIGANNSNGHGGGDGGHGLIQWTDANRKAKLNAVAAHMGKSVDNIDVQLKMAETEMSEPSMFDSMVWKPNNVKLMSSATNIDEATSRFYLSAMEAGQGQTHDPDGSLPNRQKFAKEAYKVFDLSSIKGDESKLGGGGSGSDSNTQGSSGDSDHCTSDSNDPASTSDILKFALSLAWPHDQKERGNSHGSEDGKAEARPSYVAAKEKAMKAGGDAEIYASCDRFVATVMRDTVDQKFPWGPVPTQDSYLRSSSKWKKVSCQNAKGGDIMVVNNGSEQHIMVYGDKTFLVSASNGDRTATVDGRSDSCCTGDIVRNADDVGPATVFRFSGTPDPVK